MSNFIIPVTRFCTCQADNCACKRRVMYPDGEAGGTEATCMWKNRPLCQYCFEVCREK